MSSPVYDDANEHLKMLGEHLKEQDLVIQKLNKMHQRLSQPQRALKKLMIVYGSSFSHIISRQRILRKRKNGKGVTFFDYSLCFCICNAIIHQLATWLQPRPHRKKLEVSEKKRKRIKADVEPARLTSPSAMLRTPPEHANVLTGDQVAARVTPENADKDDWILVKVIHFDREANKYEVMDEEPGDDEESGERYEVMDEEPGDDEESGERKYRLPPSCIIPFPIRTVPSAASDFPTGSQVLAVYPGTVALYKAAVVASHHKRKSDDYLLEFDGDVEDGFDGLPKRVVPFYHVVQLPEGHRQ